MIRTQGESNLLIISKVLVALVIKQLIVDRKCPNCFRGEVQPKLLKRPIVHVVGLRSTSRLNTNTRIIIAGGTVRIHHLIIPARHHGEAVGQSIVGFDCA